MSAAAKWSVQVCRAEQRARTATVSPEGQTGKKVGHHLHCSEPNFVAQYGAIFNTEDVREDV